MAGPSNWETPLDSMCSAQGGKTGAVSILVHALLRVDLRQA